MMMMYLWDISNYEKGKIKNWKREREKGRETRIKMKKGKTDRQTNKESQRDREIERIKGKRD